MGDSDFLRATGRSYRIANKIIDDLFVFPKGTQILVEDHCNKREAHACLLRLVEKRLHNDFPTLDYKVVYENNNIFLVRLSELERDIYKPDIFDDNTSKNTPSDEYKATWKRLWKRGLLN